jgi:glycosyltransferase involved in cell wall biosynthesis
MTGAVGRRRLRVLMLPHNVSQDMDFRAEALLRNFDDIEVHAFTTHVNKMVPSQHCKPLPAGLLSRNPFKHVTAWLQYRSILRRELAWADIVQWYWDFNYLPFFRIPVEGDLLRKAGKKSLVIWCGSEIRNPDTDKAINPYYRREVESGQYEYRFESERRSRTTQRAFHRLGFLPLEFIGMGHYIDPELFPHRHRIYQLVGLDRFEPHYPSPTNERPLVVHSASKTGAKGTAYVTEAVARLQRNYNFDFQLLHDMAKEEALDWVRRCDLFLDQFIAGMHGTAAVEAMAYGKPVVGYINPFIGKDYPADLPIHRASPDDLAGVLAPLLGSGEMRHQSGKNSRAYVEKYHDDRRNAEDLHELYFRLAGISSKQ